MSDLIQKNDSTCLCEPDARALIRLLSDVAELEGDHRAKKRYLVSELAVLIDADVWIWIQGQKKDGESSMPIPFLLIDGGWVNEQQKAMYIQWHSHPEYVTLIIHRINKNWHRHFTRTRQDLVPDDEWYASSLYQDCYLPAGFDHFLSTCYPLGPNDDGQATISGFMFQRAAGKPPFTDRDRLLVHLVGAEVDWLHRAGTDVPARQQVAHLPPRIYEVMFLLLAGDSKRQVAHKLDLSYHTVDGYTKQLYRRFGVRSRGELFAQFLSGDASAKDKLDPVEDE